MPKIDWRARAAETQLSVRNFINGQYQDCVGSETIEKYAGRDGQLLYKFACGDGSEVAKPLGAMIGLILGVSQFWVFSFLFSGKEM